MQDHICVNVLNYINDCHDRIPESLRQEVTIQIIRNFDYTSLYALVDEYVEQYCNANNIPFGVE